MVYTAKVEGETFIVEAANENDARVECLLIGKEKTRKPYVQILVTDLKLLKTDNSFPLTTNPTAAGLTCADPEHGTG